MRKLIIVENDKVEGTDKHNVKGDATNPAAPPPTVPYIGIGDFGYVGKMTDQLCDFIKVNSKSIALKTSQSSLNPGEATAGKHAGPQGENFVPPNPAPIPDTLSITDNIGTGKPNMTAGSHFVSVGGVAILLDGDKISTCDGVNPDNMNSTVTAQGQDFIACSE